MLMLPQTLISVSECCLTASLSVLERNSHIISIRKLILKQPNIMLRGWQLLLLLLLFFLAVRPGDIQQLILTQGHYLHTQWSWEDTSYGLWIIPKRGHSKGNASKVAIICKTSLKVDGISISHHQVPTHRSCAYTHAHTHGEHQQERSKNPKAKLCHWETEL